MTLQCMERRSKSLVMQEIQINISLIITSLQSEFQRLRRRVITKCWQEWGKTIFCTAGEVQTRAVILASSFPARSKIQSFLTVLFM